MIVFLASEFTDLLDPQLLSLGLVAMDGREHYGELDLKTDVGQARVKASSDFVRSSGVLDMWGKVPGAIGTECELGRRTGKWLLGLAAEAQGKVEIAFDDSTDLQLLEYSVLDAGLWDQVRECVLPLNIDVLRVSIHGERAAEECYRALSKRGIGRHHSLADALALRAAYAAGKDLSTRLSRLTQSGKLAELLEGTQLDESWLRCWLLDPAFGLGGRRPLDVLDDADGFDQVSDLLVAIDHCVYR